MCTLTGSSVAEKASCRAQQASRHISSVKPGPTVTNTYLKRDQQVHTHYHTEPVRAGERVGHGGHLMQEQPTLEMVSAGSDTQATSSLNRSFNIRLMSDS